MSFGMRWYCAASISVLCLIGWEVTPARACTAFVLDTPGGPLFAANLDLVTGDGYVFVNRRGIAKEGYLAGPAGQRARWVATYGSLTFNLAGRELAWGGINEAGVAVATLQLKSSRCPPADARPPLGAGYLVQYLLDTSRDVKAALEAAARIRPPAHECTDHFFIADASGQAAALEYLDGRVVVHTGEDLPIRGIANAPYAAGVTFIETEQRPANNPGASVERVAAVAQAAEAYRISPDGDPVPYALRVLTETVVAPKKWFSDLFGEAYTRWHIVFDLQKRQAHFQTVTNPKTRHLALRRFDLSCSAPTLMLDVNADIAGHVEGHFVPYDHDANLEAFRSLCDELGIEVSKQAAIGLVQLFEGFECAPGDK